MVPTEPTPTALNARSFNVKRSSSRSRSGLRPLRYAASRRWTPSLCRASALGAKWKICFGLDFAAVAQIHAEIMAARNRGAAVLLVSEDLDELLELSDR